MTELNKSKPYKSFAAFIYLFYYRKVSLNHFSKEYFPKLILIELESYLLFSTFNKFSYNFNIFKRMP